MNFAGMVVTPLDARFDHRHRPSVAARSTGPCDRYNARPMDIILLVKALVLGVVEGLTEFLPISSTGHLILAGDLLDFNDQKGKVFEIVIQTGAMFAILWEYRARFTACCLGLDRIRVRARSSINLIVAFLPAALLGLAFTSAIKSVLFKPVPVAIAFIVGGFVIIWAERRKHRVRVSSPWTT